MNDLFKKLESCNLCPRRCLVNRVQKALGVCKISDVPLVASVSLHKGEEPVISGANGICNVFFAHCNLSCVFCQNYQISRNNVNCQSWLTDYHAIVKRIVGILNQNINMVGFVSPTHQVPQMVRIIEMLHQQGYYPRIVYNTNCYDNPEVLRDISKLVNIYIPDLKYFDNGLAIKYSNAPNYFNFALEALKEMIWQKGTSLLIDKDGLMESGVILRHLVLPGHSEDSINIFENLALHISSSIPVSLMSQYHPIGNLSQPLNRKLTIQEYQKVVARVEKLGFYRGWIQEIESNSYYLPDFSESDPFSG